MLSEISIGILLLSFSFINRAGPIWSVDLKGYMHKLQLKLDPEPLDIAYTSEPEKLPPFVMVRDEDSGSNVTGS